MLSRLEHPIVQAPQAGGPSTPELAAAVSDAGGLGFLAAGYLTPAPLPDMLVATRRLTTRPFGGNLFVPGPPAPPGSTDGYARAVEADAESVGSAPGEPRWDDDGYEAKLDVLLDAPPAVVSFTFGLPTADT